jgi:hypothetical protein
VPDQTVGPNDPLVEPHAPIGSTDAVRRLTLRADTKGVKIASWDAVAAGAGAGSSSVPHPAGVVFRLTRGWKVRSRSNARTSSKRDKTQKRQAVAAYEALHRQEGERMATINSTSLACTFARGCRV